MMPNSYLKQKNSLPFFFPLIFFYLCVPIKSIGQIVNDSCFQALEIFCGETRLLDFSGSTSDDYDHFGPCGYYTDDESIWFKITGTGDIIHLSACSYYPNIKIFEGNCDSLVCFDNYISYYNYQCENSSAEIGFKSEIGKIYYLYFTVSYPNYQPTLKVSCEPPTENDFCESAKSIKIDSFYQYNHLAASPSKHPSCQFWYDHIDADTWYTFSGTGEILKLVYDNPYQSNKQTRLIKGNCDNYECIDNINIGLFTSVGYLTELGETYYLRFYDVETDTVSFKLSPIVRHPADECENAPTITLKDTFEVSLQNTITEDLVCSSYGNSSDVWYSFIGMDSTIRINITGNYRLPNVKILTGDCASVVCENITEVDRNNYNFHTEKDQTYFLNFTNTRYDPLNDTFQIALACINPPSNNDYVNAIPLRCTDTLYGNLANALTDKEINYYDDPSVWYKVIGTDNFYQSSAYHTPGSIYNNLHTQFYFLANEEFHEYGSSLGYHFLEKDSIYFLNVRSRDNGLDSFLVTLNCQPIVENDICEQATIINISDTIIANTYFTLNNEVNNCGYYDNSNQNPDTWFQVSGDGKLYDFTFKRPPNRQKFSIFKGDCDSLICVEQFWGLYNEDSVTIRTFLENQANYFIKVFNQYSWENQNFEFYFQEVPIAENDKCIDARMLTCGDIIVDSLDFAVANDTFCELPNTYYYTSKGIWYQMEGANKYIEVYFPESNTIPIEFQPSFFEGNCSQLNCINDQLRTYRKKHVFWGEAGKTYYIAFRGQQKFKFEISCFGLETNDLVENALSINCGNRVTGYGFFASEEETEYCPYPSFTKDLWWKIEGNNQFLYVEDAAALYNSYAGRLSSIHVYSNGNLECLENFQNRIFLNSGTTYYLRYGLRGNSGGHYDYDLNFSCFSPPPNDECLDALDLNCGDTLITNDQHTRNDTIIHPNSNTPTIISGGTWVKIIGDNTFKRLSAFNIDASYFRGNFQYFKGDGCGNLSNVPELVEDYDSSVFYAEEGIIYYAVISDNNNFFKITLDCIPQAANDYCHNATPISCGDTINESLNYAFNCDYGDSEGCYAEKRLWYTIEGTGDIIELDFKSYAYNDHVANVEIYFNNCCQKRTVPNVYGTQHKKFFQSKSDESYLIGISLRLATDNDGNFDLMVNCMSNQNINVCENALPLNNQEVTKVAVSKAVNYYNTDALHNHPVSWVSFIGSGGIDTLIFDAQNLEGISADIHIDFEQNCRLSHNIHTYIQPIPQEGNERKMVFSTIQGVKYLIAFEEYHDYRNEIDTIGVSLKYAEISTCKIELESDTFLVDYNRSISIKVLPGSTNGVRNASIREGTTGTYLYDGAISFYPKSEGNKIIRFNTDDPTCWGHDYFYIKFNNPPIPELQCPDSTIVCQDNINHENEDLSSNYFKSRSTITSNSYVNRQAKVVYMATEKIKLKPGFHVKEGADFTAMIDGCDFDRELINQEQLTLTETIFEESQTNKELSKIKSIQVTTNPNPFLNQTILKYTLPELETVSISLYALSGQKIKTILPSATQGAGFYNYSIDGHFLDTGIYILELLTSKERIQKKIVKIQ